ncbi:MAG: GntR family transcriptional regulator [Flavobacteriales bacterium]|nr:GntR family transcriptional regulator [Flavobacteriales bacterium]
MLYEKRDHHLEGNTLEIGVYHNLTILRETAVGLFLGDDDNNEVLLPNKYVPEDFKVDEKLRVFVYLDSGERRIATTIVPKLIKGEFGFLKCNATNKTGAFLDLGLEKDLFVPFKEQAKKMEEGKSYNVYMFLDEETDRLLGSNKLSKYFKNEDVDLEQNQAVDLLIDKKSDLGINVIVNDKYTGFIFSNQIFQPLRYGERISGYVKEVREDGKIDITLQKQGIDSIEPNAYLIIDTLEANEGFIPLNDKSDPELIREKLGVSKKIFKKAIGALYKERMIEIKEDGIYLIGFND